MYRILWVKCTTPAGCKSIRIAGSSVMDGWKGHISRRVELVFSGAGKKVLRYLHVTEDGYPSGAPKEKLFKGNPRLTREGKLGYPYPSGFTKQNRFYKCFQQGYRDAISTRETIFKTISFSTKI